MKIAVLTSGILPVPAVQGGAVENLIDFCLEYNHRHHLHDITIFSISHPKIKELGLIDTLDNHFVHIDTTSWLARVMKRLYLQKHGSNEYYHYSVEFFFEKAFKLIKKQNYNMIIVENRPGYALKLKGITSAKLVLHQENDFLNINTKKGRLIYDTYASIINTSAYVTNRVKTINELDTKCQTVLNGIDTQKFFQAVPTSRKELALSDEDFIIVYSGRLNKDKGILQLILAIKMLRTIPNLKLLIIGASNYGKDEHSTPFIKQLEKESEPIQNQVVYTGFVDYPTIPSYLKMADIAVVPSMWEEPFGLTVVEAMAAGLPLITTHSGGIPEICEGVATIVERENIVDNLAAAIQDLYDHPKKREMMATASLKRSRFFDKETYAKNFFKALEGI